MTLPQHATDPYAEAMPPLRMFFSLRGRVSRRQFWLFGVLALIGLAFLGHALLGIAQVRAQTADLLVNLLLVWPALAVSFHSVGTTLSWARDMEARLTAVSSLMIPSTNGTRVSLAPSQGNGSSPRACRCFLPSTVWPFQTMSRRCSLACRQ